MLSNLRHVSRLRHAAMLSALTAVSVVLETAPTRADKANFRVQNDTSHTLTQLYVSDSSRNSWDDNLLGREGLSSGSGMPISFPDSSPNRCLYDIRAVFEAGQVVEDYRIDVCAKSEYTFFDN